MSAVAEISMALGYRVSGSALEVNDLTRRLSKQGLVFFHGHDKDHVHGSDIVVVSAAVPENNVEVVAASKRAIPVYLYSEYLGMLMAEKRGVAVAGTHGKTTTTAMIATIAHLANLSPTVVCGGVMRAFESNALVGKGELFIAEACEYNRSFLHLPKSYAIVTNIEPEHLDYYSGIEEIREVFRIFLESTGFNGFVCVNGDDATVRGLAESLENGIRVITVGYGSDNAYRVESRSYVMKGYRFEIYGEGFHDFSVHLPIPGAFNVFNASLAAVCARNLGINTSEIVDALEQFRGTRRRLELLKQYGNTLIYSDYAHHPTEIMATLQALREKHAGTGITLVFQPHQYSRTEHFFKEFVDALQLADRLLLTEVYRQRDSEGAEQSMNSSMLYEELKPHMHDRAVLVDDKNDIHTLLKREEALDGVIVFMGAGDIDDVAREFANTC